MLPPTVGVEEELFLVDPRTRLTAPASTRVLKHAAEHEPDVAPEDLDEELFQHQVETRTTPTRSMEQVRQQLAHGRRKAADAAAAAGLVTMASGSVPTTDPRPLVTHEDRYLDMMGTYGEIARLGATCGMHVHVQVDSPDVGVAVIDHLGPWLPAVLAVSANSPYHQDRDTGHAPWRSQMWAHWPSAGPTQPFGSLEGYRSVSRFMQESGAARDEGMLYFDARLSRDHPTVEIRITDVCTDPDDAVLIAALLRGLVAAFSAQAQGSSPAEDRVTAGAPAHRPWRSEFLKAAQWRAARYGLSGELLDPTTGTPERAATVLGRLVAAAYEPLDAAGDLDLVRDGIRRVMAGTGASHQRAAFERDGSLTAVVDDTVARTNEEWRGS